MDLYEDNRQDRNENLFLNSPAPQKGKSSTFILIGLIVIVGLFGLGLFGRRIYRHFFPRTVQAPPAITQSTVRFIEGWSIRDTNPVKDLKTKQVVFSDQQMADAETAALKNFDFFGENIHPKNLEGYLFPDTYFVIQKDGPEVLINKMISTLDKKLSSDVRNQISKNNMSIYETLTLASIIEKEVGRNAQGGVLPDSNILDAERKNVASVFYNRLKIGMPLQSDATVNYATGKNTRNVTEQDLKYDSAYNTYKYNGLPPGPIGNPSWSSILASVYPAKTNYLYFLSKPDGTAVFARTLDEHNINKAKYLK